MVYPLGATASHGVCMLHRARASAGRSGMLCGMRARSATGTVAHGQHRSASAARYRRPFAIRQTSPLLVRCEGPSSAGSRVLVVRDHQVLMMVFRPVPLYRWAPRLFHGVGVLLLGRVRAIAPGMLRSRRSATVTASPWSTSYRFSCSDTVAPYAPAGKPFHSLMPVKVTSSCGLAGSAGLSLLVTPSYLFVKTKVCTSSSAL